MTSAAERFLELGYAVVTHVDVDGLAWADLQSLRDPDFVVRMYGRGATVEEAVASALDRWRVEQIGTDNPRKPGEPLP